MVTSDTGQFSIVPHWLIPRLMERPRSGGVALVVYVTLGRWADYETGDAWPSHKTIATECGLSQTAVKDALNFLREVQAIDWTPTTRDDGSPGSNIYRVLRVRPTLGVSTTEGSGAVTPVPSGAVTPTNKTQCEREPTELDIAHPAGERPTLDLELDRGYPAPNAEIPEDELFERFWRRYPRKVGKTGDKGARGAFARAVKRSGRDAVTSGTKRWQAHWAACGTPLSFIPHPATWLNQSRYDDDPGPVVPHSGAKRGVLEQLQEVRFDEHGNLL